MNKTEFFKFVDDTLVILETENVKEAIKQCYVESVSAASAGNTSVSGNSIVAINAIAETLPATDDSGIVLLNKADMAIYRYSVDGLPVFQTTLVPGMLCVLIGRDYDSQNIVSIVRQFVSSRIVTPFDGASMNAIAALQWGDDTCIIRANNEMSDILCINNLNTVAYEIDRYEPAALDGITAKAAVIYNNNLFVGGINKDNAVFIIKFEKNSLEPTIYRSTDLPVGLTSIGFMTVCNDKLYVIQQGGVAGTEKWYSFDMRSFTDVTPADISGKIRAVLPFNNGHLFIGDDDVNAFAYHLTPSGFDDKIALSIATPNTRRYATDGKFIYGIIPGSADVHVITSSYVVSHFEIDELIYFKPFISKSIVHVVAKADDGNAVIYKSDTFGSMIRGYEVEIDMSAVGADVVALCSGIGTDDNVMISIDKLIYLLKRTQQISIK